MVADTPAPRRKTRQKPRKKALNRQQAEQQQARFGRLLDSWVAKMTTAAGQVAKYRKKTAYYEKRVAELTALEVAAMEQAVAAATQTAGRPLRAIDLGAHT